MKLDVKRRDDGMVEIHIREEDGKIVVYLCEDSQAAIFKLAHLLFSVGDDPKENRRSILVGTFEKKKPRPRLTDEQKKLVEGLKKAGLVPVDAQKPKPITYPYTSPVDPNLVPIGIGTTPGTGTPYPIMVPGTVPPNPISVPGTGVPPYTITWGTTTGYTTTTSGSGGSVWVNPNGEITFSGSGGTMKLAEKPIPPPEGMTSNSGGISSVYYVSSSNWVPMGNK